MLRPMEMFGGMLVLRRVATANVSARKTHAEVDPRIAGLSAFFALMFVGFPYLDLIEMCTFARHRMLLFLLNTR
jgi:hypothetical protein